MSLPRLAFAPVALATCAAILAAALGPANAAEPGSRPNIVFVLADDLGYGDLGCYGQEIIQTPQLDRMAEEGLRFTQFYAGSTVCASSRCVLMTGQHLGHCTVRGNGQGAEQSLSAEDITVAKVLQNAGYATALVGKWGLGDMRPETMNGLPTRHGFDYFFGYLNQVHAHNYFPTFLWRNDEMVGLRNTVKVVSRNYGGFLGGAATQRQDYSHDLCVDEAFSWIRRNRSQPFFLYLALTLPHANNEGTRLFGNGAEIPDYGQYADRDWPEPDKGQAAMVSRIDRDMGRLLALLRELQLEKNTLVVFSSDNGPHNEAGHDPKRFQPAGPLRGMKRALYDGGIRVPTIAWWPETIAPGGVSDHVGYFGDLMATACELSGVDVPPDRDSVSFLPTLRGELDQQQQHDYLYWEFYEQGGRRAVRWHEWKGVRPQWSAPIELYRVTNDLGEQDNVASEHPEIVAKIDLIMQEAHTPSPYWHPTLPPGGPNLGEGRVPATGREENPRK